MTFADILAHNERVRAVNAQPIDLQFCDKCGCHYSGPCPTHGLGTPPAWRPKPR